MRKYIFLIIITFIVAGNLFAQTTYKYSINWENSKANNSSTFPDAEYLINDNSLPIYTKTIELDKNEVCTKISLGKTISTICSDTAICNNISNYDMMFYWSYGLTEDISVCDFTLYPYYIDSISNNCFIITAFEVTVTTEKRQENSRDLPKKSILSEGEWYRFKVLSEGIYCLTYDDLQSNGVNLSNVESNKIRIFAKKGYILPEANSEAVLDNPSEVAILVKDGNDGIFNSGDSIIFYVDGPHNWIYDSTSKTYSHQYNFYSDTAHFLLNIGTEDGKRITTFDNSTMITNFAYYATNYTKLDYYQNPLINLLNSGNSWYGESFDNNNPVLTVPKSFSITEPTGETNNLSSITYNVMCVSNETNYVNAIINDQEFIRQSIVKAGGNNKGREKTITHAFTASTNNIDVKIRYFSNYNKGIAYLKYVNLNLRSKLQYPGHQFSFRDPQSAHSLRIIRYIITKTPSNINVWNITDPINPLVIPTQHNNDTTSFYFRAETIEYPDEFIAFYNKDLKKPIFDRQISNQNLFALTDIDYLLIVPEGKFIDQAELFGQFHQQQSGLKYSVVELDKIYNEFSCGTLDLSSIRNLIRYMYVASEGEYPKHVLLFGTTSFDYKNILATEPNLMPSFESYESLIDNQTFVTDDYYVLMDANEGEKCNGIIDIPIGRIPFNNEIDIEGYFNKISHYYKMHSSPNGTWKSKFVGVADDGTTYADSYNNMYPLYFEELISEIYDYNNNFLFDKVYIDAFEHKTTSNGNTCPGATDYLVHNFNKGALILTYHGHGSKLGWAGESLFTVPDIQRIDNLDNMPMVIAMTCDYLEYDKLNLYPSAKHLIQSRKGGTSSLITTSRISYYNVCKVFMKNVTELLHNSVLDGQLTAGKILLTGKQASSPSHLRSVHLFGDPAMKMNYPDYKIGITSFNQENTDNEIIIKNSELINIKGEITNYDGKFNGFLNYELYDQPTRYRTYGDGHNIPFNFYIRDKIINEGTVEVIDNEYNITFRLPNNLNAGDSTLKLQLYAYDTINNITAIGSANNIIFNGESDDYKDKTPPEITAYINHLDFKNYDIITSDATLYINLYDESGIDSYGNNIGNNITYLLNEDYSTYESLNSFFKSNVGDYQTGYIEYNLSDLPLGENYITIDAYDIMGNFTREKLYFIIADKITPELFDVFVSPNPPIDNHTNFYIKHNILKRPFDIKIEIWDFMGKKLHEINKKIEASPSNQIHIPWNCKTSNGSLFEPGVYIYKVTLYSDEVRKVSKSNKFFIKQ